jgi:hypothetical protein
MSHSPVDAIVVFGTGATLVVPRGGNIFYVRSCDGAIGRRQQDVMLWFVAVDRDFEAIATQSVDEDLLGIDELIGELVDVVESSQSGRGRP